jgi:hypothetical protein
MPIGKLAAHLCASSGRALASWRNIAITHIDRARIGHGRNSAALQLVFEKFGIDYCCDGKRPLAEARNAANLSVYRGIPVDKNRGFPA